MSDGLDASRLDVALQAAADAEEARGDAVGELTEVRAQLAAALSAHADWDRVSAELIEESRQTRERLDAIETSTTWRVTQQALAPYRLIRSRLGR